MKKPYTVKLELYDSTTKLTKNNYVQGDLDVYPLHIMLFENSTPFKLPQGAVVSINFENQKTGIVYKGVGEVINADGGEIEYNIIGSEIYLDGDVIASVEVTASDSRLTWQKFKFSVERSLDISGSTPPAKYQAWSTKISSELSDIKGRIKESDRASGIAGDMPLADYVMNAIPKYLRKVQKNIQPNSIVWTAITDTHANPDKDERMQNIYAFKAICDRLAPHFAIHLGDVASDKTTGETQSIDVDKWHDWTNEILSYLDSTKTPTFVLHGNHDTNLHSDNKIEFYVDSNAFYSTATRPFEKSVKLMRNQKNTETLSKPYFYCDFDDLKLRVVCLDSSDFPLLEENGGYKYYDKYGWQQEQLTWLCGTALDLKGKTDYEVLVLNHTPPVDSLNYINTDIKNGNLLVGILNAFVEGTRFEGVSTSYYSSAVDVDFSSQGKGKMIAFIHGHTHADNIFKPADFKFQPISLAAALAYVRPQSELPEVAISPSPRVRGEISGICLTTMVYNPLTKQIKAFRFGAGEDYAIQLEKPEEKLYALKMTGGRGDLGFGNNLSIATWSKISFKLNFNRANGTQYVLHSSLGDNQRLYFGIGGGSKPIYGFGEQSSISGDFVFMNGVDYQIDLMISPDSTLSCYINGKLDKTLASAPFMLGQDITFAQNKTAAATTYLDAVVYDLKFINRNATDYAVYKLNEESEAVAKDASGNGKNMKLYDEYSWVKL